jgi:hypothetical protein
MVPNRGLWFGGLAVTLIGLIFGGVGAWLMIDALRFNAAAHRAEGTVVRLNWKTSRDNKGHSSSSAYPVVRFQAEGREVQFEGSVGASPPHYDVGEKVTVLYAPGHPDDARIESTFEQFIFPGIFLGLGVLGLLIGLAMLIVPGVTARRHQQALARGRLVKARVVRVHNDTPPVRGRSPWVIVAEYRDPESGKTLVFKSPPIWNDPEARYPVGSEVQVVYLPDNPAMYQFQSAPPPAQS